MIEQYQHYSYDSISINQVHIMKWMLRAMDAGHHRYSPTAALFVITLSIRPAILHGRSEKTDQVCSDGFFAEP